MVQVDPKSGLWDIPHKTGGSVDQLNSTSRKLIARGHPQPHPSVATDLSFLKRRRATHAGKHGRR